MFLFQFVCSKWWRYCRCLRKRGRNQRPIWGPKRRWNDRKVVGNRTNLRFGRFGTQKQVCFLIPKSRFLCLNSKNKIPSAAEARYWPFGENFTQFTGCLWWVIFVTNFTNLFSFSFSSVWKVLWLDSWGLISHCYYYPNYLYEALRLRVCPPRHENHFVLKVFKRFLKRKKINRHYPFLVPVPINLRNFYFHLYPNILNLFKLVYIAL